MFNSDLNEYELEDLRAFLAKNKKFIQLSKLYSKYLPEIKNNNTPILWNKLNTTIPNIDNVKFQNPMLWDRIRIVNSWITNNSKILDLGFGSGILEDFFVKNNRKIELEGLDISPKSVIRAKSKFKNWNFKVGFANKTGYKNKEFDYVICLEVLEHIPTSNIFLTLREIYRILKNKGIFIISVPLNEDLEYMINNNLNLNAHVRIYKPELIKAELLLSGFKILKSKELFAFSKDYVTKTLITQGFLMKFKNANNILILSQKS